VAGCRWGVGGKEDAALKQGSPILLPEI